MFGSRKLGVGGQTVTATSHRANAKLEPPRSAAVGAKARPDLPLKVYAQVEKAASYWIREGA